MKIAITRNNKAEEDKKHRTVGGLLCSPLWFASFLIQAVFPTPLDMMALTSAPMSLITAMSGITLVLTQVLAALILKERMTMRAVLASGVVFCGVTVATVFGPHGDKEYRMCALGLLLAQPAFVAAEFAVLVATCASVGLLVLTKKPEVPRWVVNMRPVCYAVLGGAMGSQSNIGFKALGELVSLAINGDVSAFMTVYPYLVSVVTLFFAIAQLSFLNQGIAEFQASLSVPLYLTAYIILCVVIGGIYFQEFDTLDDISQAVFPVGLAITLGGVLFLAQAGAPQTEDQTGLIEDPPSDCSPRIQAEKSPRVTEEP